MRYQKAATATHFEHSSCADSWPRITRAFALLIITSKGRIANIGSINGIVSFGQASAYSMSKHAIEAFTDALALFE